MEDKIKVIQGMIEVLIDMYLREEVPHVQLGIMESVDKLRSAEGIMYKELIS